MRYKNQIELFIDVNWFSFLKKKYHKNAKIEILYPNTKFDHDILIISGGNDLPIFNRSKANLFRNNLDNKFYSAAIKKNVPIVGICHGAMFIAKIFGSKITPSENHLNDHDIFPTEFGKKLKLKTTKINSYHNYVISKLSSKLIPIMQSQDNNIESFITNNRKILCIMWHPERYNRFRSFDLKFLNFIK